MHPVAGLLAGTFLAVIALVSFAPEALGAKTIERALLVGVGNYPDPEKRLPGIGSDLDLLVKTLVDKGVMERSSIKILADREGTRSNIVSHIKTWLIDKSRPGDTVLFFYSGHGIQVWDKNGDEVQDGMDEAFLCYDAKVSKLRTRKEFRGRVGYAYDPDQCENLLVDDEIGHMLQRLKGRTVVFISDSCHSGSVFKRIDPFFVINKTLQEPIAYKSVFEPRTSEGGPLNPVRKSAAGLGDDLNAEGINLVALTASEDSQPAQIANIWQDHKGYHSIYSFYFYKGLLGGADADRDGETTVSELHRYVGNEIRKAGFAQIPQAEFRPVSMGNVAVVSKKKGRPAVEREVKPKVKQEAKVQPLRPEPSRKTGDAAVPSRPAQVAEIPTTPAPRKTEDTAVPSRPAKLGCLLEPGSGLSPGEEEKVKNALMRHVPVISWTAERPEAACRIALEKNKNDEYGARLSDATGEYWETQKGQDLDDVIQRVAGNLKAFYIHSRLSSLDNTGSGRSLEMKLDVRSQSPRAPGEVVKGDTVGFRIKADKPGYLYTFSVDTMGTIHPLYPMPKADSHKLRAGGTVDIGTDGSFEITEPLGKEVVVALLTSDTVAEMDSLWSRNDIGVKDGPGLAEQEQFLDLLKKKFMPGGKPVGDWAASMVLMKSFEK
ncbi:MAG: caspase family protein [Pseudomonadota bacterium]